MISWSTTHQHGKITNTATSYRGKAVIKSCKRADQQFLDCDQKQQLKQINKDRDILTLGTPNTISTVHLHQRALGFKTLSSISRVKFLPFLKIVASFQGLTVELKG